jgi:hypothetical protein
MHQAPMLWRRCYTHNRTRGMCCGHRKLQRAALQHAAAQFLTCGAVRWGAMFAAARACGGGTAVCRERVRAGRSPQQTDPGMPCHAMPYTGASPLWHTDSHQGSCKGADHSGLAACKQRTRSLRRTVHTQTRTDVTDLSRRRPAHFASRRQRVARGIVRCVPTRPSSSRTSMRPSTT